jgi:hypothetical protein
MIKIKQGSGTIRKNRLFKHPVKLTALLYLKDALQKERYEDCAELIRTAREFGAVEEEIEALLEDPRRTPS